MIMTPGTRWILTRAADGTLFELTDELKAGRDEASGLRLTAGGDNKPSRNHARVFLNDGVAMVEDLGSTNGTFVNGTRLPAQKPMPLKTGDKVRFHLEEFAVVERKPQTDKTELALDGYEKTQLAIEPAGKTQAALPEVSVPRRAAPEAESGRRSGPEVEGNNRPAPAADIAKRPAQEVDFAKRAAADGSPDWLNRGASRRPEGTSFVDPDEQRQAVQRAQSQKRLARPDGIEQPHLTLIENGQLGRAIILDTGDGRSRWTVGKGQDCSIRFSHAGVSELHAEILFEGGHWKVNDRLSSNGTWVDGEEVKMTFLDDAAVICFGPVECLFRLSGTHGVKPVERPAPPPPEERRTGSSGVVKAIIAFVLALLVFAVLGMVL